VSDKVQGENESMESATPMPGSGWMRDDHRILADQADRFFAGEVAPGYEGFEAQGFVDRDIWTKAGAAGFWHRWFRKPTEVRAETLATMR
jgi:hypothetical protein